MTDEHYDIVFVGRLAVAAEPEQVKVQLAKLFNTDRQKIERLFSGKAMTIKKNLDKATALKYQDALAKAGAIVILQPVAQNLVATPAPAPTPPPATDPETTRSSASENGFSLAPAGSSLLREEEKQPVAVRDIDISALHLAELGAIPAVPRDAPPPAPDTSHLSTAAPGADLRPDNPQPAEPVHVDVSYLSVAPPGTRLAAISEEQEWNLPDISAMQLGPENDQSPLQPPRQITATAPDTSHLSLTSNQ